MKRALTLLTAFGLLSGANVAADQGTIMTTVAMDVGDSRVVIDLFDTPASRDFLARLPVTLSFEDFAGTEKIAYPPGRLTTQGSPTAPTLQGDVFYYAPWGNIALFYKGDGRDSRLYTLGRIVSGKDALATVKGGFDGTITVIDQPLPAR